MMRFFEALPLNAPASRRRPTVALMTTAKDLCADHAFRSLTEPLGVETLTTRTVYMDDEPDEQGQFTHYTDFKSVAANFPASSRLDLLAFSCTSGTIATGVPEIRKRLEDARPGLAVTTPGIAMLPALAEVGARRIGFLSPYPQYMHEMFLSFFRANRIDVASHLRIERDEDELGDISPTEFMDGISTLLKRSPVDAIYLSCTGINVVPYLHAFEQEASVPVLSSSQVLAWDALRHLDIKPELEAAGTLFSTRSRKLSL